MSMTKELTPLEALERIKDTYYISNSEQYKKDFETVKTALKKQIIDDNEHPRKKDFKRDNRLRLAYQEMGRYSKNNEVPQELRGKPYGDIQVVELVWTKKILL